MNLLFALLEIGAIIASPFAIVTDQPAIGAYLIGLACYARLQRKLP